VKQATQWDLLKEDEDGTEAPKPPPPRTRIVLPEGQDFDTFKDHSFEEAYGRNFPKDTAFYLQVEQLRTLYEIQDQLKPQHDHPYGLVGPGAIETWLQEHPRVIVLYHIPPYYELYRLYWDQGFHRAEPASLGTSADWFEDHNWAIWTQAYRCLGIDPNQTL